MRIVRHRGILGFMVVGALLVSVQVASSDESCVVVEHRFDDEPTGAEPANWLVDYRRWTTPVSRAEAEADGWGVAVDEDVFDGASGKSLRFLDTSGGVGVGGSTSIYLALAPSAQADVGFSLRAATTLSEPLNLYVRGTGLGEGVGIVLNGGSIRLRTTTSPGGDVTVGSYEALTWYRFRLVVDTEANTLVTFVDGDQVDGPRTITAQGDPQDVSLILVTTKGTTTGTSWLDEVEVIQGCSDTEPPEITLLGDDPARVECGEAYHDAGATAADDVDGDLTSSIVATSTVDSAMPGTYQVVYSVSDDAGNAAEARRTVIVEDTTAPALEVTGVPARLWPPDHRLVTSTPSVVARDACDDAPVVTLTITSNEADDGLGDGDTAGDAVVRSPTDFDLRAERSGKGAGRIYTLVWTARDASGNESEFTACVTVPHSRR